MYQDSLNIVIKRRYNCKMYNFSVWVLVTAESFDPNMCHQRFVNNECQNPSVTFLDNGFMQFVKSVPFENEGNIQTIKVVVFKTF